MRSATWRCRRAADRRLSSVHGGHKLNHAVLTALMADTSAWAYVEMPGARAPPRGHADLAAGFAAPAYGPDVS